MINTVHDSIVFDVEDGLEEGLYLVVHKVMTAVPEYLRKEFGIDFTLPMRVDCKIGQNWMEMTDYEVL